MIARKIFRWASFLFCTVPLENWPKLHCLYRVTVTVLLLAFFFHKIYSKEVLLYFYWLSYAITYFVTIHLCWQTRGFYSFVDKLTDSRGFRGVTVFWFATILGLVSLVFRFTWPTALGRLYLSCNSSGVYFQIVLLFSLSTRLLEDANRKFGEFAESNYLTTVPNWYYETYDLVVETLNSATAFYSPFLLYDVARVCVHVVVFGTQTILIYTTVGEISYSTLAIMAWDASGIVWLVESCERFNVQGRIFKKNLETFAFYPSKRVQDSKLLLYVRHYGEFDLSVKNFFHLNRTFLVKMGASIITNALVVVQLYTLAQEKRLAK